VALQGGTNVCLRRVEADAIFALIRTERVTHMCGAPVVYSTLIAAHERSGGGIGHAVHGLVAGAPPPMAMIEGAERMGLAITHVYGLTETYGPAAVCTPHPDWAERSLPERARLLARQGVAYPLQEAMAVLDPATMQEVPRDGETIGEIMFRGNITMKGYLKNPAATGEAFAGGWFHSGDLAVVEADGYARIKDRAKDIIISGGENISSIEVEDVLYRHPAVECAAVVAMPDAKWGEVGCAFIQLRPGATASAEELLAYCREHMARFKVPKSVVFGEVPKTATGKIQKAVLRQEAKARG
jgi:fatty-acyl-CoA synthase